jgi:phosphonate transport system substrate-binding protein
MQVIIRLSPPLSVKHGNLGEIWGNLGQLIGACIKSRFVVRLLLKKTWGKRCECLLGGAPRQFADWCPLGGLKQMTIWAMIRTLALVAVLTISAEATRADHEPSANPIRFGLTAVVVRENIRFLDRWAQYLSEKMERPVKFVRRRSYREVMDLMEAGALEFAWICGFPFVQNREPEFLDLMAVPVFAGKPLYHSYIIVHKDSPHKSMSDLEGQVFAFSDPESNSGFLYPQFLLAQKGRTTENHFRQTFFTYNHAETIEAVGEQVADGGAVDSYIWDYLAANRPDITARTRVIKKSPTFGFPPLVSRRGIDPKVVEHMKSVLMGMATAQGGKPFLDGLMLDRFGEFQPDLFKSIRVMANQTRMALFWRASKTGGASK